MQIKMEYNKQDGQTYTKLYCDVCGKQIEDAGMAMAAWNKGQEVPIIAHKITCDDNSCMKWMELSQFFIRLMANTGMNKAKILKAIRMCEMMNSLE